jgi:ABC-type phosphate transport system substrate-binding protein
MPLDQIDAALADVAKARADLLRSSKALKAVRREAKADQTRVAREAARYARNEDRIKAARAATITGERMAAAMTGAITQPMAEAA